MVNSSKYFCLAAFGFSFLFFECNRPVPGDHAKIKEEVIIDSANDAWFNCYINDHKWEKTDSLSASFSVKGDDLFLNVNSQYNSVTYEKISLLVPVGKVTKDINKQLVQLVNDTLLALIIYSFAAIDYSSETPVPVNHMAFELKPTALVSITKVDTARNLIDGTFKAIAEDESKRKYGFRNGIFRNVAYKK